MRVVASEGVNASSVERAACERLVTFAFRAAICSEELEREVVPVGTDDPTCFMEGAGDTSRTEPCIDVVPHDRTLG